MEEIDFSEFEIIYKDWFETLDEAKDFVSVKSGNMEITTPMIIPIDENKNNVVVQESSFVDLKTLMIHHFVISVNNNVYAVDEYKHKLSEFDEVCKCGKIEELKVLLRRSLPARLIASGLSTAIHNNQLSVVKYFIDNNLIVNDVLLASPLYWASQSDSLECFKYLLNYFEPQDALLRNILQKDANKIFKFVVKDAALRQKIFSVSQKDFFDIKSNTTNSRYDNDTMKMFKENYIKELTLK